VGRGAPDGAGSARGTAPPSLLFPGIRAAKRARAAENERGGTHDVHPVYSTHSWLGFGHLSRNERVKRRAERGNGAVLGPWN
jgi:hypothetical protein